MTDISDKIQQLKKLSGIFTGSGGDRVPPHGTTHTKNGPDPIPSELDGVPVDLEGMSTGETIVLDASGELVPGAPLGSLVDLQTAYDNGGSVTLDAEDLTITLGNAKKLIFKDKDGNAAFTFEDVGADNRITINPDILKLKDSNVTTAIDLSSVGNVEFITTDRSIVGAVNELATAAANYFNKLTDDSDDITEGATNLFLTAAERAAIAGAYIKATDDATDIQMEVGNHDVQHLLDDLVGRGSIEGFGFTDNGGGNGSFASGDVYLHTTASKGSTGGVFTVPGASFTFTDGFNNYVYAEYNGGSPRLQVTVNPTAIRYVEDKIIVAFIRRDGTTLRRVPFDSGWQSIHTLLSQRFFEQAEGEGDTFAKRLKGDVISTLGTRNPTISAGVYGAGTNRIETPLIDCTAGGTFTQFYGDTVNGFTYNTGQTQLNNTQYYNGSGGLATLNTSRYSVRWVWRLFSVTELYINISATNIIDLGDAIDSPVPTDVPPLVAQFGQLVGRYIVQQGSNTVTSLPRWTTTLSTSGVITHEATVDKNSEPEFQHYDQSPTEGATGWSVAESDYFAGGTKAGSVKPVDATLLETSSVLTTDSVGYFAVSEKYAYTMGNSTGRLYQVDKFTGSVIQSAVVDTTSRPTFWDGKFLVLLRSDGLRLVNEKDLSYQVVADTYGSCWDIAKFGSSLYTVDSADNLRIINSDYDLTSSVLLASVTNRVYDIATDGTYIYGIDADTAASSYYVRKWLIADGSLVASSSAAFAFPASGIFGSRLQLHCGYLFLTYGSASSKNIAIINPSTMSVMHTYASAIDIAYAEIKNGLLFGNSIVGSDRVVVTYTLPALTMIAPRALDLTSVDNLRVSTDGITGVYSAADLIRNGVLRSGALWRDRLGVSVTSVETSLPASPVDGALYLLRGGTSPYEGTVAEYFAAIGWAIHTPEHGSRVTHGYFTYTYQVDRWEKTFEIVHTQEIDVTDTVAYSDATLYFPLLLDGGVTNGEAIVVDEASACATIQNTSFRFVSKREAVIAFDATALGTQRKEIDTMTGQLGITSVDFNMRSGFLELTADGDVRLDLNVVGTATFTTKMNVTFKVRGTVQNDVGTYCGTV